MCHLVDFFKKAYVSRTKAVMAVTKRQISKYTH